MRPSSRKVLFKKTTAATRSKHSQARRGIKSAMAEIDDQFEPFMTVPPHLSHYPRIIDELSSATSRLQHGTIDECLPMLCAITDPSSDPFDFDENGLSLLKRSSHIDFVEGGLQSLPAGFVTMDASRPWLMYWSLLSLYLLGEDTTQYGQRIIKTFTPLQNRSGGFGGGQGHISHLAATYAVVLAIAMVEDKEAYNLIDRSALWQWLGQLKQSDGSFRVCEDGERDVRGAYCALVAITLLNLPWELPSDAPARAMGFTDFRDGLGCHLSRCQTFEGGLSANPTNEAHGAYTFCALACLSILGPPQQTITQYLDLDLLIKWLSERQYAPEGGFAGRTNKVVDGCYSHWIGGCWPLVEAAVSGPVGGADNIDDRQARVFSSEGLIRYILGCCQAANGGLRDKPSKRPDAYHTCYNLAGLSMAQHEHSYHEPTSSNTLLQWSTSRSRFARDNLSSEDGLAPTVRKIEPVYVIPHQAAEHLHSWSQSAGPL